MSEASDVAAAAIDNHLLTLKWIKQDAANEYRFFDIQDYMDELLELETFLKRLKYVIEAIEEGVNNEPVGEYSGPSPEPPAEGVV
jgi:hypothetical protein